VENTHRHAVRGDVKYRTSICVAGVERALKCARRVSPRWLLASCRDSAMGDGGRLSAAKIRDLSGFIADLTGSRLWASISDCRIERQAGAMQRRHGHALARSAEQVGD